MEKPKLKRPAIKSPSVRRLKAFAFDPSLNLSLENAVINQVVVPVPWEPLELGPSGSYLEIFDIDPPSGVFYPPLDLESPYLLARDGLDPSEGNPQFHQQMVYAVAMNTITKFENALGRRVLWGESDDPHTEDAAEGFVPQLRIYPHALREANAFYSPEKKALLFGYFPAAESDPGNSMPGGMVFTCLSHDIIAHETTHALLDGIHRYFIEPSNRDVLAFHEAFADIVALFQHFTYPEVLRHQIAHTRGDLASENMLGQLARQFGQALGRRGSLRDGIGQVDPKTGEWKRREPDPTALEHITEPHERGAVLVAAIFDAFLAIYQARIGDLIRIATGGSGVLPPGEIHPDLVNRLAAEVVKSANHILTMCIRALDYCPPVDISFGDYLRALITADMEFAPDDKHGYRIAIIESFRRHGIYPRDIRSLSIESLVWRPPVDEEADLICELLGGPAFLRSLTPDWVLESDREKVFNSANSGRDQLFKQITNFDKTKASHALRQIWLSFRPDAPFSIDRQNGWPNMEVDSVRPAHRLKPNGQAITDLVVTITQERRGYFKEEFQTRVDRGEAKPPSANFTMRGGCTLLVSLDTGEVRYSIGKRVESERRLREMRQFLQDLALPSLRMTYFGDYRSFYNRAATGRHSVEPFALLHGI